MTRFERSIPAAYFDEMYAADPAPWRFAVSQYERDKYAATLASLPRHRYASALEISCSIGVLARQLARCDALLSIDAAAAALGQARRRCTISHMFETLYVRMPWPTGRFDLILLSAIVYYDPGSGDS